MGLNPAAADGLAACTDAQLGKGTRNPVSCPAASKIGTVAVETPPLPPGSLTGNVFVGKQLSRDPTSGEEYRIFVDAESARYGVSARLIGNVAADPRTGRLTTTLAENPQVPFSSFKLHFDEGPRAVLSSPPICGPNESVLSADPYTETATATAAQSFTLPTAPERQRLREDARRATLLPGLLDQREEHEGRRLQPLRGPHLPRQRRAGVERGRRHACRPG